MDPVSRLLEVDVPNKRKSLIDGWDLKNKSSISPSPPPLHNRSTGRPGCWKKGKVSERRKKLLIEKKKNIIVH